MVIQLFIQKIVLSILVGALLGLEREYTKSQEIVGLRTFALISLFGCLTVIISDKLLLGNYLLPLLGFIIASMFAIFMYVSAIKKGLSEGFTTNFAIIIAYLLGMMAGFGLFLEAIFLSIVVAVILFSKERLHYIVRHLTEKEVGDLLEFLVLLGIIYPIIPQSVEFYGITIPVFMIWVFAVAISLTNFFAFLGARYFGAKQEISILSFLGGLMSSTISIASISNIYKQNKKLKTVLVPSFLIVTSAMLIRNFAIAMIPATETTRYLLIPLLLSIALLFSFSYIMLKKKKKVGKLHIKSPFNVPQAVKLGIIFLGVFILLDLAQDLGSEAFYVVAFFGGMLSSSGTSISLVSLLLSNVVGVIPVSIGIVLANIGAVTSNYIFCYFIKCHEFFKSMKYIAAGFAVMLISLGILIWFL